MFIGWISGAIFHWTAILDKMKNYSSPGGHKIIEATIDTLPQFDEGFSKNDFSILSQAFRVASEELFKAVPFITNKKVDAATRLVAEHCLQISQKLASNRATLKDAANVQHNNALEMLNAMT